MSKLRLLDAEPIIEKLWLCALYDAESNIIDREEGQVFAAGGRGKGWNGRMFTRDIGFSSILGLSRLFPNEMAASLEIDRKIRLALGLRADRQNYVPGSPLILEDIDQQTFKDRYGTNPYTRRTDDVLWLWWADDLFQTLPVTGEDWDWVYQTGQRCFRELYAPFYDSESGLYFGQASFVDVGGNGYPAEFGRETIEAIGCSLRVRAASTNCLYYRGLEIMAKAAELCGRADESADWMRRAGELRESIRRHLVRPDGRVAYFLHEDGRVESREHALGTAFAILLGVLDQDEAARAIRNYPLLPVGVPLYEPFFPGDESYHNNSSWPFVSAFFLRAREHALGTDESSTELEFLIRSCRDDTFYEWCNTLKGQFAGQPAQLWTVAPFIGRCLNHYETRIDA